MAVVSFSTIAAGTGGFVINGEGAYDYRGFSVAGAGDVNGDGLVDLIVGGDSADPNGNFSGRSYVVVGKPGTGAVDLSAITAGIGGFVINGRCEIEFSGHSVASAGDVNGDGLADLIVGAYGFNSGGNPQPGRSYVVFGKTATSAVDVS